jgi:SET domain-containing protein
MNSALVTIRENGSLGRALYAVAAIAAGERIHSCRGTIVSNSGIHTLQIAAEKHLLVEDKFQYLSHSCDPNCKVITNDKGFDVVTLQNIVAHSLLSFNYLTTEWNMHTPFHCACGASRSLKHL